MSANSSNVKPFEEIPTLPGRDWPLLGHLPYAFGGPGGRDMPGKQLRIVSISSITVNSQ